MEKNRRHQWLPLLILGLALRDLGRLVCAWSLPGTWRRPAAIRLPQAAGGFDHDGTFPWGLGAFALETGRAFSTEVRNGAVKPGGISE